VTGPVEAFRRAAESSRMFWLDGGGSREWSGRRSIVGVLSDDDVSLTYDARSRRVLRHRSGATEVVGDDVFDVLADEVARDAEDPAVSWVGYLGYACRPDLPARLPGGTFEGPARPCVPDAVWMRARDAVVFQHEGAPPSRGRGPLPAAAAASVDPAYATAFAEVQRQLRLGNTYEVNLTYRVVETSTVAPVTAYLRLRTVNPAPYAGYLQHHGVHLLSASPERFATVDRHRWLETRPIKGTTPRGVTAAEDEAQRRLLTEDPRFRAENLMVTDLLRNDLGMVCEPGTVTVPALMQVESYPAVHQLVTTVRGRLRGDVGTLEALRALFPAGSMTGAPKRRTMEVVADVESTPRGVYAGAFGWVGAGGRADLGVVIRSLVATGAGPSWRYEAGTGGGVTVRSTAEEEYAESRWKLHRLLGVLSP
jgi:para-aminobenzoate synthetase